MDYGKIAGDCDDVKSTILGFRSFLPSMGGRGWDVSLSLMECGFRGLFLRTSEERFFFLGVYIGAVCWILRVLHTVARKDGADIDAF